MIVLDASTAVESLLAVPLSHKLQQQLDRFDWQIIAPQLLLVEVLQVLRHANYVALAEVTEVELLTSDARLANAPGHHARITLVK